MSDSYVQKPVGDNHMRSSTGNAVQNLLVALSVAGLWLIVTAAEPQDGCARHCFAPVQLRLHSIFSPPALSHRRYSSSNYRYPDEYWTNYRKYAVSIGAVGLFFGLLALGLARFKPSTADKKLMAVRAHDVSLLQAFAFFFVLWWGVGTGVGTFKAPFFPGPTETFTSRPVGNGYFSLWTGFIASLLLLGETMSMREGASSFLNHTGGLFFAAVMLLIATIKYVDPNDGVEFSTATPAEPQTQTTDHIAVFGMASASATILITLLMMFADVKEAAVQTLVPILVLLWAATAGVLTFREGSPFTTLNNGYLASWLGFFMATRMMGLNAGSRIFQILALGVIVLLAGYFPVGSNSVGGGTEMVYENNIVPDDQAYMIAVGALAGFLALFHYWCSVFKPALLETVLFNVADSPVTVRRAIALFLVPWAAAGAIVGTFAVSGGGLFLAPITIPLVGVVGNANGFFAIWLLLIVCIGHLGDEMEEAKAAYADALSSTMFLFLFASTILIGSLLFGDVIQNGDNGSNPGRADFAEYIYGLVIACVSAAFALYHLVLKAPLPLITKIGTPLLALAWVAAAGVLTFRTASPSVFTIACNGFFSVYFGLFLSVSLFAKVHLFSSRVEPPVDDVLSAA